MTEATAAKRTEPTPTTAKTTDTAAAAKGKPGRKPGQKTEPKVLAKLDLSQMVVAKVTDPETMRAHRRQRVERDEDQVAIDSLVKRSHQLWVEAGRPDGWNESIVAAHTLTVPAAWEDTIRTRIQRAGTYFGVAIRFGTVEKVEGGKVRILFFAKDKPVREEKGAENGSNDATAGE